MSYTVAKSCFKENIDLRGGAQGDPIAYNLHNGLFQLTQQLERDIGAMSRQLEAMRRELSDLQHAVRRQG